MAQLTCILTRMPSPLLPLTIAVTTTRVSLATKFRMHRSFLVSCDWEVAWRSNLRALAQATRSITLQMYCNRDRGGAIVRVGGIGKLSVVEGSFSGGEEREFLVAGRGQQPSLGGELDFGKGVAFPLRFSSVARGVALWLPVQYTLSLSL